MTPSRDDRGAPGKKPDKPLNAKPEPTGRQAIDKALQDKAAADKKAAAGKKSSAGKKPGKSTPARQAKSQGTLDSPAAKPFPATGSTPSGKSDHDGRHRAPERGARHRLDEDNKRPRRTGSGSSEGLLTEGRTPAFGTSEVPPVPKDKDAASPVTSTSVPTADNFSGEVDPPKTTPRGTTTADKKPAPSPNAYGSGKPAHTGNARTAQSAAATPEPAKKKAGPAETNTAAATKNDAATNNTEPDAKPEVFDTPTHVPAAAAKPTDAATPATTSGSADAAQPVDAKPVKAAAPATPAKPKRAPATPVDPPAPSTPAPTGDKVDHVSKNIDPDKAEALAELPLRRPTADTGSNRQIKITEKAMNKVISAAVRAVPGTISRSEGIDKLTGRNFPRYEVRLDDDGDAISIDAFIAVGWPAPVAKIAEKTRETIITWVGDMTDVPVVHANVTVGYVEPGHDRVTAAEIDAFDPHPTLTPVTVTQSRPNVPIITGTWDITPHTVTGEVAENIRSVPVPRPAELRAFSPGSIPEAVSPVTKPAAELVPIKNTWKLDLRPIEVADPAPGIPVVVADEQPLAEITVPDEKPLKPIEVAACGDLKPIEVAPAQDLRPITATPVGRLAPTEAAPQAPLRAIGTRPRQVRGVTAPKPAPLTKVTDPTPHRLADVSAPNPVRLAEVKVAKTPKLSTPEAPKLRLARIVSPDGHKVAHPQAPVARRLAKVEVSAPEVTPVDMPAGKEVATDLLPPQKPLKKITVSPLNVRSIKVVDK
ncbi:Asp23/Gls24 family envelope stress response protein [Corynebacterium mendelii]|uniref:Asp23/Gls24 family envelope stress response protein n=1 Tax=Corynebacterium mendelii TaxID=2765362 RepID=A0A939ITK1_9CORY|nr:Asp23/Gls24 family envelope stress response protein [Corynebacterium mendelii]MBN9643939.1 Asp23/Gls24 family envelope stress response protein [Corynebacterium mendelii]